VPVRIRTRAGRLKREVFFTRPLNHIVVEPLLAALCDPLIAARVMTVEQMERGEHASRWPRRPFGAHLTTINYHCLLLYHWLCIS
jgi:hypothetical protein